MTTKALDLLQQYRNDLKTLSADRDAVIDDLVQAIMHASKLTGKSVNTLVKLAGISRQTYYLRAKDQEILTADPSTLDAGAEGSFERITRFKDKLALQDVDLAELKKRRAKGIAGISTSHSATDIAEAAGVTAVWVRTLRRGATSRQGDAG